MYFHLLPYGFFFLAEIYAGITSILGCIVNVFPLSRPQLSLDDIDRTQLPTVDVMIPTYNESQDILEITIRAAKVMDYPADKVSIHLLDDGGTDEKNKSSRGKESANSRRAPRRIEGAL